MPSRPDVQPGTTDTSGTQLEMFEVRAAPARADEDESRIDGGPRRARWPAIRTISRRARRIWRIPAVRLVVTALVAAAVAVAVVLQFRPREPARPNVLSASPLTAVECLTGRCAATSADDAALEVLRDTLHSGYTVGGTRIVDPRGVLRQVAYIAGDGERTLTVDAARIATAPADWASERATPATSNVRAALLVVRSVLTGSRDRATWVVEVRAVAPTNAPQLGVAARQLAADPRLLV